VGYRLLLYRLGRFITAFAFVLLIPILVGLYFKFIADTNHYPQPSAIVAFVITFFISLIVGGIMLFFGKKGSHQMYAKETIILVVLIWISATFLGSLPYVFSGTLNRIEDAWFESVSGFTTTGNTIIYPKKFATGGHEVKHVLNSSFEGEVKRAFYGNIAPVRDAHGNVLKEGLDAIPRELLFWRHFSQWIGAMGVICLFAALFPLLGIGMRNVFQIEMPGVLQEGIAPRIQHTVKRLIKVYFILSIMQILLMKITNFHMPWFDAICTTFSTISTGGFAVISGGIATYGVVTEWIIYTFMVIGGINFALFYFLLKGRFFQWDNTELKSYIFMLLFAGLCLSFTLVGQARPRAIQDVDFIFTIGASLRQGFFHAASALTGTGYFTSGYTLWPYASQLLVFLLPFIGGMVGSTTGGMKISRNLLLFRSTMRRIQLFFKPDTVRVMKVGRVRVNDSYLQDVFALFWLVIAVTTISTFVFVIEGYGANFSLGVISSMVTNSGMPFAGLPSEHSCGCVMGSMVFLPPNLKFMSIFLMLLGRLEYFILLILFVPSFWRRG
jgi:trk system potassium uptake protein